MFGGLIVGLLVAWIGSWFGLDRLIIQGVMEFTALNITSAGYYTLFAFIGLIGGLSRKALVVGRAVLLRPW